MSLYRQDGPAGKEAADEQLRSACILGGIAAIIAIAGILLDIIVGSLTGGNLSAIPQTAVDRFAQFRANELFGLYNLDLLNTVNQILMIPVYFALYMAHRGVRATAALALILFLVGTAVFVTTNTALPMLDLSRKYFTASTETQRASLAAAGEALLARGAHGSPGVFIGFVMPNIAGLVMSFAMLRGKAFGRVNSILGIAGSVLILTYIVLVTFVAEVRTMATAFAMPGGLMLMAWMVMFTVRLFKLGTQGTARGRQ
jgi:hypothetical protein